MVARIFSGRWTCNAVALASGRDSIAFAARRVPEFDSKIGVSRGLMMKCHHLGPRVQVG